MDLLSHSVEQSELVKGDHIYSWRIIGLYSHHGIFIGKGKVIHFVSEIDSESVGFSATSSSSSVGGIKGKTNCTVSYCGLEKVPGSGVKLSCINCFTKNGTLCRFKYQEIPTIFCVKRSGTCTTTNSDPPEEVIHRATFLYENGYIKYNLITNNCEDFALYCKTGLWSNNKKYQGRSSQVNAFNTSPILQLSMVIITAVPIFFEKLSKDLGVRGDVVKVPVEELSNFILSLN